MNTHYHVWTYVRAEDGTIRSMERDDRAYPTGRQAFYALTYGRNQWLLGRVEQCAFGALCQPPPTEMFVNHMPFGPRYVTLEQLESSIKSTNPSARRSHLMQLRADLHAAGRFRSIDEVRAEQRQVEMDAEAARFLRENLGEQGTDRGKAPQKDPRRISPPPSP